MSEESSNTKKLVCFVCAQELPDLESWKQHIIDRHEEKEQYLLCPECGIPCRDLFSHYKVHHRGIEIPDFEQVKANRIVDWSPAYRRSKKKKSKWKEGLFDSIKMGKKIHYRSSWERDAMVCFEKCVDVDAYFGDDHLCIEYQIHGRTHRYWPDFTLKMKSGKTYVIEIKPAEQSEWEINVAKWTHAAKFCLARDWDFQVWTQKHIRKIKARASRHDLLLEEHVIPSQEEAQKSMSVDGI